MMKALYLGPGNTTHDRRWVNAFDPDFWRVMLVGTDSVTTPGSSGPHVEEVFMPFDACAEKLRDLARGWKPDIVVAGPLHRHTYLARQLQLSPCIALSWGYDIQFTAKQDEQAARKVKAALDDSVGVIVDCRAVADAVSSCVPFDPGDVLKVPWGVEAQQQEPSGPPLVSTDALGWDPDSFVIVSNRTMDHLYRVDVVVEGFARARRNNPRLRLVLLGDGPLQSRIRQLVQDLQLGDTVYFGGRVREDDMPRYLSAADLYVSASLSDGSSVSLLQAMWAGLPVVVTDIPSNAEWVTPGESGWLVPGDDADTMARAMTEAARSTAAELDRMSEINRDHVAVDANWSLNTKKFNAFCLRYAHGHGVKQHLVE